MKTKSINLILAALATFVALSLAGCDQNEETDTHDHDSHSTMQESAESSAHSDGHDAHMGDHHEAGSHMEKKPADARAVTITATDFAFDPKTITATPGEKLFVTLVNKGQALHMWQLEGRRVTLFRSPMPDSI